MSKWQLWQGFPGFGCGGGGGMPWQLPQAACVPSTRVQVGVVFVPPEGSSLGKTAPWQLVDWQVPPVYWGLAPYATAAPEKVSSAGGAESRCPGSSTPRGTT